MKEFDRMTVLIVDETSINSFLRYMTMKILLTIFMIKALAIVSLLLQITPTFLCWKGIFRQWKQPVCYIFSSGPSKSITTKKIEVLLKEYNSMRIKVAATICNQEAANQAALNSLISDPKQFHLRRKKGNN